jgi:hypothetical protein
LELAKLAKNGLLNINTCNMHAITCVETHYTLLSVCSRLWLKNNRLCSSVNACPPSTNATSCPWNHTNERILEHLLCQVAACCNNRFTKLSQIVHQNRSYLNRTQTCPSQLEVLSRVNMWFSYCKFLVIIYVWDLPCWDFESVRQSHI